MESGDSSEMSGLRHAVATPTNPMSVQRSEMGISYLSCSSMKRWRAYRKRLSEQSNEAERGRWQNEPVALGPRGEGRGGRVGSRRSGDRRPQGACAATYEERQIAGLDLPAEVQVDEVIFEVFEARVGLVARAKIFERPSMSPGKKCPPSMFKGGPVPAVAMVTPAR